ncbi:MAG TPA: hypothetical protein VMW17_07595 [Candidatus Binatia bacterium]|nr:hypothetical protein [Candidatus Binatia bacterium]
METHQYSARRIVAVAMIAQIAIASAAYAALAAAPQSEPLVVAQAQGSGELQPRYEPVQEEPKSWYNSSYIFGLTSSVARSTMVPAAKAPLFLLTVPLDIVLLPFAAIGGLFG